MGLSGAIRRIFGDKSSNSAAAPNPAKGRGSALVRVRFRDLDSEIPSAGAGWYTYAWSLPAPPQVGMRVWVPGSEGLAPAVVVDMGQPADLGGYEAQAVKRLATNEEIEKARRKSAAASARQAEEGEVWLRMMLAQAGISVGRTAQRVPNGWPEIPPVTGDYSPDAANEIARVWWRAYRLAEASPHDRESVKRLKSIAQAWFEIRDQHEAEQHGLRLRQEHPHTLVRGLHHTEWLERVQELKRAGQLDEALAILKECMAATIAENPGAPAPWYFEQGAIVLRKLKRGDEEVACLHYYLRNAAAPSAKLVERLSKLESET